MKWIIYTLISAFAAGVSVIFTKLAIRTLDPSFVALVRLVIATAFTFAIALFGKKLSWESITLSGNNALLFVIAAGLCVGISWLFFLHAMKYGSVIQVIGFERISLVFAVGLCALVLGECTSLHYLFGAALITLGSMMMII